MLNNNKKSKEIQEVNNTADHDALNLSQKISQSLEQSLENFKGELLKPVNTRGGLSLYTFEAPKPVKNRIHQLLSDRLEKISNYLQKNRAPTSTGGITHPTIRSSSLH